MIQMIRPQTIAFKATVTEDEIRDRMALEAIEQIGGIDPATGKPAHGITWKVTRGDSRKGGYVIEIFSPVPARIMLPPPAPAVD